jgi:uridine kinase
MMHTMREIVDSVARVRECSGAVLLGVSGFGGSGKSTLARELVATIPDSVRIRGDDFLDPERSHRRSADWDGVERLRLRREVLDPFHLDEPVVFHRFDWGSGRLGKSEALPEASVIIVDAVGLFHPELAGVFDVTVWVDVDLTVATQRGKARDHRLGRDHDRLWDEVWVPNEREFVSNFDPRKSAQLLFSVS